MSSFCSAMAINSTSRGAEFNPAVNGTRLSFFKESDWKITGSQIFLTMRSTGSLDAKMIGTILRSESFLPSTEILRDVMTNEVFKILPTSWPRIAFPISAYASGRPGGNRRPSISLALSLIKSTRLSTDGLTFFTVPMSKSFARLSISGPY